MIYLYGVIEKGKEPPDAVRGIDFAPLRFVHQGQLTAVVSSNNEPGLAPSARHLWQHESVVEALMERGAVLPVRFSTWFPDKEAVRRYLGAFHETLHDDLQRFEGCVELSLRIVRLWGPESGDGGGNLEEGCPELLPEERKGRTFDVARRAAVLQASSYLKREECLGVLLSRPLEALSVDYKLDITAGQGVLLKAAYLVDRKQLVPMQKTVREMMTAYPHFQFLCTGPWPPYHFVQPVLHKS